MVKLVYTLALGASGAIRESSSLSIPTKLNFRFQIDDWRFSEN